MQKSEEIVPSKFEILSKQLTLQTFEPCFMRLSPGIYEPKEDEVN